MTGRMARRLLRTWQVTVAVLTIALLLHSLRAQPLPAKPLHTLTGLPSILVSMERADASRGAQHIECWLVARPAAMVIMSHVITVDCVSDPESIFANDFEAAPTEVAP